MNQDKLLNIVARWTSTAYSDTTPFVMNTKTGVKICWLQVRVEEDENSLIVEVGRLLGLDKLGKVSILSNEARLIKVDNSKDDDSNCELSEDEYYVELINLFNSNAVTKDSSFRLLHRAFPESICNIIAQYTNEIWAE